MYLKKISLKEIGILISPFITVLLLHLILTKFVKIDTFAERTFSSEVKISAKDKLNNLRDIDIVKDDDTDTLDTRQISKILPSVIDSERNIDINRLPDLKELTYINNQPPTQNHQSTLPVVEAVYISNKGKFVILFNKVLREGETINGITVLSIDDEKVRVKLPDGERKWLYVKAP